MEEILKRERAADIIIHLGDGADAMLSLNEFTAGRPVYTVKGNCDSYIFGFSETAELNFGSKKLFACHGHRFGVKYGLKDLQMYGSEHGFSVCLFGHTHMRHCEYSDGLYLFNPGAVKNGEYGIVEIDSDKISAIFRRID